MIRELRGQTGRISLTGLHLGIGVVLTAGMVQASAVPVGRLARTDGPCPDAVLLAVPGSEAGNSVAALGGVVRSVATHLASDLGADSLTVQTIRYPAVPVWEAVDNYAGAGPSYLTSLAAGEAALARTVAAEARVCSATRLVIAGDGQGADVVGGYLNTAISNSVQQHIVGIALISDPRFDSTESSDVNIGSYQAGLPALFQAFPVWTGLDTRVSVPGGRVRVIAPAFSANTISACNALDPVCSYSVLAGQVCFGFTTWLQLVAAISPGIPALIPFTSPSCPSLSYPLPGQSDISRPHPLDTAGIAAYLAAKITPKSQWAQVSAGGYHSCGIRTDHSLWCWGLNLSGQLGTGNTISQRTPVQITGTDWAQVSAGGSHTCAIRADHTLWCWGFNVFGQLGIGIRSGASVIPAQVTGTDWAHVSAGFYHTCAIRASRTLWCWGAIFPSVLEAPVQVFAARIGYGWMQVSTGDNHSCAIREELSLTRFDGHSSSGVCPRKDVRSWRAWGRSRPGRAVPSPRSSRPRLLTCASAATGRLARSRETST